MHEGNVGKLSGGETSARMVARQHITKGHRPTCDCGKKHRPGLVLDPFCGRGTVPVVAHRKGYHYIGIDLVDWGHLEYRAQLAQGVLF